MYQVLDETLYMYIHSYFSSQKLEEAGDSILVLHTGKNEAQRGNAIFPGSCSK